MKTIRSALQEIQAIEIYHNIPITALALLTMKLICPTSHAANRLLQLFNGRITWGEHLPNVTYPHNQLI